MHPIIGIAVLGFAALLTQANTSLAAELPTQLVGRYAHFDIVAYNARVPLGVMRSQVITYGFTDLTIVGDHFVEAEIFCHAEHRSNLPIKTTVTDRFTRAILPPIALPTLTVSNGQIKLVRPETPTGLGVQLADAQNDVLPTDPKDPRFSDDDHDGHPGVTVQIDVGFIKGQLYLARREIFAYDLTYVADGRFEGVVRDRSEQLTLGAYPSFLAQSGYPVQDADLSKSPIVLQRVDSSYTCDRLMDERAQWFPPEMIAGFVD